MGAVQKNQPSSGVSIKVVRSFLKLGQAAVSSSLEPTSAWEHAKSVILTSDLADVVERYDL